MAIRHITKYLTIKQLKVIAVPLLCLFLSSCFGGSIAQQLVRSMLMQGADRVTGAAIEAKEQSDKLALQKMPRKDSPPDPYSIAFVNAAFENMPLRVEPLPEKPQNEEVSLAMMQETKLVQVEVWSLLAGDEKQNVLEKARLQGSTSLPPQAEWRQWQIAVGATENKSSDNNKLSGEKQPITFLIPPEIGKLRSGEKALVELSNVGELSVARYTLN